MTPNLRIKNNVLLVSHFPLNDLKESTRLTADIAAASGTLTVRNIVGFAINQVLLVGEFGDENAEIIKTHASTAPTGSTITLASNTVFDHALDTPVYVLDYDQVEFSRATTLAGTKTVLTTKALYPAKRATGYNDITNSTGYGFARFKNSISAAYSSYSTGTPYAGNPANSVEEIVMKAVKDSGNQLNDEFCLEGDLIRDCQEAQATICSARDWSFELYKDLTTLVTVQGETDYSLGLNVTMKYPNESQSVLSVRMNNRPIGVVGYQTIENAQQWAHQDTLAAAVAVGATSVTLHNSNGFDESGTVYLRGNGFVAYTANDQTTGVLSGISATAITAVVPEDATVWQNVEPGEPNWACVIDSSLVLDVPPDSGHAGLPLKFRFLRRLAALTDFASTTEVPFYQAMSYYVQACIENRKRNFDEQSRLMQLFTEHVSLNAARYKLQVQRSRQYYVLGNTARQTDEDVWWNA